MTPRAEQPEFQDDDPVLVSPRYLAGETPSEDLLTIFGVLHMDFGWHVDVKHQTLASPDGHSAIVFTPQRQEGHWWQVAHRGHWNADFTRNTPAEAIVGILWRLPQLSGDDTLINFVGGLDELPDVARMASTYGWHRTRTGWTSPDGHCVLHYDASWRFTHSVHDQDGTEWTADFSRYVPEPFVSAFLKHLANDVPLERTYGAIPHAARESAFITPNPRAAEAEAHLDHEIVGVLRRTSPSQGPRRPR